jgi:hypothetical protein
MLEVSRSGHAWRVWLVNTASTQDDCFYNGISGTGLVSPCFSSGFGLTLALADLLNLSYTSMHYWSNKVLFARSSMKQ